MGLKLCEGKQYGRFFIIHKELKGKNIRWECKCFCGKTLKLRTSALHRKYNTPCLCEKIHKRKFLLNESFLEKIDNSEKAYWIGFIYADGHVDSVKNSLTIALCAKDVSHLYKINKSFSSNCKIETRIRKKGYKDNSSYVRLTFNSKKLTQRLLEIGFSKPKNLSLIIKNIPATYLPDFVRGVIDGDGCFSRSSSRKNIEFNVVIDVNHAEEFQKLLINLIGLNLTKIDKTRSKFVNRVRYSGNVNIKKMYSKIYYKNCLCLDRKLDILTQHFGEQDGA